jgi:putative ABC transport system substrate-binding protein
VGPLQAASRTIPVVFVLVPDPVGQGFVHSLARPGGNVTGFTLYEFGMGGKWLQLLKEIAPSVTRAAVIRDATTTGGGAGLHPIGSPIAFRIAAFVASSSCCALAA